MNVDLTRLAAVLSERLHQGFRELAPLGIPCTWPVFRAVTDDGREMFVKAFDGWKYQPPEGINQTYEIGIWLPKFADVDAEYAKLKTAGADLVSGEPVTFPWGLRNFYVADPEGNLLEIGSYNAE